MKPNSIVHITLFFYFFIIELSSIQAQNEFYSSSNYQNLQSRLKETQDKLSQFLIGLTDQQVNFKSDSSSWTISQIMEHIAIAETSFFEQVINQVNNPQSADSLKSSQIKYTDSDIVSTVLTPSIKLKARETLQPRNKFGSCQGSFEHFNSERLKHIEFVEKKSSKLRHVFMNHGFFGTLDAYQYIIFINSHTEKHFLQMKMVRSNPDFPKN